MHTRWKNEKKPYDNDDDGKQWQQAEKQKHTRHLVHKKCIEHTHYTTYFQQTHTQNRTYSTCAYGGKKSLCAIQGLSIFLRVLYPFLCRAFQFLTYFLFASFFVCKVMQKFILFFRFFRFLFVQFSKTLQTHPIFIMPNTPL